MNTAEARVLIRSVLVFFMVGLASVAQAMMGSDLQVGEVVLAVSEGFTAACLYGGLNYVSPTVNASVGRT